MCNNVNLFLLSLLLLLLLMLMLLLLLLMMMMQQLLLMQWGIWRILGLLLWKMFKHLLLLLLLHHHGISIHRWSWRIRHRQNYRLLLHHLRQFALYNANKVTKLQLLQLTIIAASN
jgi:hypothetical protein